jgi:hypothetical protein
MSVSANTKANLIWPIAEKSRRYIKRNYDGSKRFNPNKEGVNQFMKLPSFEITACIENSGKTAFIKQNISSEIYKGLNER